MTVTYSTKMATKLGINAALVAAYMHYQLKFSASEHHNRLWMRCPYDRIRVEFPFMGKHAVGSALKKLTKNGVLLKHEYNVSRFDRTLSYAFTEYGKAMMEEVDV